MAPASKTLMRVLAGRNEVVVVHMHSHGAHSLGTGFSAPRLAITGPRAASGARPRRRFRTQPQRVALSCGAVSLTDRPRAGEPRRAAPRRRPARRRSPRARSSDGPRPGDVDVLAELGRLGQDAHRVVVDQQEATVHGGQGGLSRPRGCRPRHRARGPRDGPSDRAGCRSRRRPCGRARTWPRPSTPSCRPRRPRRRASRQPPAISPPSRARRPCARRPRCHRTGRTPARAGGRTRPR